MALLKNLALMTSTTALRLVAGVVALAITGRALGPQEFGILMYWMSIGGLLGVFGNFGLGAFLLREIGRDRSAAPLLIARTLTAKLILCAGLLAVALLFVPAIDETRQRWIYIYLLMAMLLEGFTEYVSVGFRARDRFDVDSKLALIATVVNCSLVAIVAWHTGSTLYVAVAYLLSRGLVLAFAGSFLFKIFGRIRLASLMDGLQELRRTYSYALDTATGALFGQVDSLVLNHFIGPVAVGVHQAGMRFFMAGMQAATVMTNVFVPRASEAHRHDTAAYQREKWYLQIAFLTIGAIGGAVFSLGGPSLMKLSFGTSFVGLAELMPLFGLLFVSKFACASWGVVLMIEGQQSFRALASAMHWVLIAAIAALTVPRYGIPGWLSALIFGNLLLLLVYVLKSCRSLKGNAGMVGLTILSICILLPFLNH